MTFTLTAVVVEQQSFPGNLLIGYDTMREEDITIIPAKEGGKISYKFLPFDNIRSQDFGQQLVNLVRQKHLQLTEMITWQSGT